APLGNDIGVRLGNANNLVGGTVSGARNIISGNTSYGVDINGISDPATGNVVAGNFIGTDLSGTLDLGNAADGVLIRFGATLNTIGGTTAAARNVISGNNVAGVQVQDAGTNSNVIAGNFIGTNPAGL